MIKIAIVEDEEKHYKLLKEYIDRYGSEEQEGFLVEWFESGVDFLEQFHSEYDLILLDVELPVMDGIAVARDIRRTDSTVLLIFVTNMAQYAIHGYEVDAMDYVVKPVEYYPFAMRLKRAARVIRELSGSSILLPFEDSDKRVPIKDILYVEVHSHTVEYYTYFGRSAMTGTLKQVEQKLPEKYYVRCNSCYLVNLKHVTGIKDDSVVIEGTMLKISRSKKREFMERLSTFYSEGHV